MDSQLWRNCRLLAMPAAENPTGNGRGGLPVPPPHNGPVRISTARLTPQKSGGGRRRPPRHELAGSMLCLPYKVADPPPHPDLDVSAPRQEIMGAGDRARCAADVPIFARIPDGRAPDIASRVAERLDFRCDGVCRPRRCPARSRVELAWPETNADGLNRVPSGAEHGGRSLTRGPPRARSWRVVANPIAFPKRTDLVVTPLDRSYPVSGPARWIEFLKAGMVVAEHHSNPRATRWYRGSSADAGC